MEDMIKNLKDRAALQQSFTEGAIPTQQDFTDLINAVLVKRDDRFFGYWQKGAGYSVGDVVLYTETSGNVGIYAFLSKKDADAAAKAKGTEGCSKDDCVNDPPPKCCRWQLIHVDTDDGDWHIVKDSPNTMYANVVGKIGVGTKDPKAFLHLNDATSGANSQFLFNPKDDLKASAHLRLVNGAMPEPNASIARVAAPIQLDQTLDLQEAAWLTNAPLGFVFKKTAQFTILETHTHEVEEIPIDRKIAPQSVENLMLLVINSANNRPRIGIGTEGDMPKTALEIANKGHQTAIQLDVDGEHAPQLILLSMDGDKQLRVVQSIDNQHATWSTSAAHGYLFKHQNGKTLIALDENGHVGIGTETPQSKLEISDAKGKVSVDFSGGAPIIDITNVLSNQSEVNLSLESQQYTSIISTNARDGLVFQKETQKMMSLAREEGTPNYNLMLNGASNSNGVYVRVFSSSGSTDLVSGLALLDKLKPQVGKYEGDQHPQIGFSSQRQLPSEIVRQFPDSTFGIAQQNLVAILVRAVQELSDDLKASKKDIGDLKKEIAALKTPKK
jgi:hypothetical protein